MFNTSVANLTAQHAGGRPYGGESPADRVARRRGQFLDAGLELFGTDGYRATTVRGLCKQAKVTDRYFYESFSGTEDLLAAVYQTCMGRVQQRVVTALASVRDEDDIAHLAAI